MVNKNISDKENQNPKQKKNKKEGRFEIQGKNGETMMGIQARIL